MTLRWWRALTMALALALSTAAVYAADAPFDAGTSLVFRHVRELNRRKLMRGWREHVGEEFMAKYLLVSFKTCP